MNKVLEAEKVLQQLEHDLPKELEPYYAQVPLRHKRLFLDVKVTGTSWTKAIKLKCLECVGYSRKEVKGCTSYHCPLYTMRPYQDGCKAA